MTGGASGHETDKRTAETPADYRLLAKGTNPDDGGAAIHLHAAQIQTLERQAEALRSDGATRAKDLAWMAKIDEGLRRTSNPMEQRPVGGLGLLMVFRMQEG